MTAAMRGAARAAWRRARRGPTLPSWPWSEELFVGAFRGALYAGVRELELMSPRPKRRHATKTVRRGSLVVEDVLLDGVAATRFTPQGQLAGTILYLHGGGFITGSVATERRPASDQALSTRCETYSIEYRLAPRHPFPAALDDSTDAYRALLAEGADPNTTIFFGGSAGACLALATLLRARDMGLPMPAGAVLLWPYVDFTFSGASIKANAEIDMLPLRDLASVLGSAYVGDADPTDPLLSPIFADLTGLPPLLIIAGGAESLLSCAERLADNARSVGVETQFTVYPEQIHGWMILPKLPATIAATNEIQAWMTRRVGQ